MRRSLLSALLVAATAQAASAGGPSLYVSRLGDDASNNCQTLATPCRTLGHAISQAIPGNTIQLAGGTYVETIDLTNPPDMQIRGGYNDGFTASDGTTPTVLRSKNVRPLTVHYDAETGDLELRDLTFAKSFMKPDVGSDSQYGGAIFIHALNASRVHLHLSGVFFTKNKALAGGAVAVVAEDGSETELDVLGSRFSKNKAFGCSAILMDAIDSPPADVNVIESVFDKNKAIDAGGAVCVSVTDATNTASTQIFTRNAFLKNKSALGTGIFAVVIEGGSLDVSMTNNVFLKNKAFFGGGMAGLALAGEGVTADIDVTSFNNTYNANKAKVGGGGVMLVAEPDLVLGTTTADITMVSNNDIISGNKAPSGADVALSVETIATATLERSFGIFGTVEGNTGATIVDGTGLLTGDPGLVKPGKDFHLRSTSQAVDAGTCSGAPIHDFDGEMRPSVSGCDIGADELVE